MSSEESEGENALKIRPLPWLSTAANQFKKTLDEEKAKQSSNQSKRQTKRKIIGEVSDRERPVATGGNGWILFKSKNSSYS